MSSDESEKDSRGGVVYRAKRRVWREKKLNRYMQLVDRDRNVTNAYGNRRAGNQPRTRVFPAVKNSASEAVPGLPLNFYDPDWYNKLSSRDKKHLGAKEGIDLVEIEERGSRYGN
jgi:hypothetical protein